MLESYQESALVPDKLAEANRQVAGWSLGVKSLENYHAYMLTGFGALKAYLYRLGAATEVSLGHAKLVRDGAGGAAQPFKDSEKTADKHRKSARAEWAGIQLHLPSYKDAWTRQPQQLADLHFMRFLWTTVTVTLTEITDRPYNIFTSWTDTATGLTDTSARIQRFITDIIDPWAAALINLTATEVAAAMPAGQPPADAFAAAGLTGSWNAALANPFETLSPVREFFMVKLINANLRVPGIVGVGEAHLKGIGDKIVEGKVHQSYEQFVRAISDDPIVLPL
jgi:hypothetical protein